MIEHVFYQLSEWFYLMGVEILVVGVALLSVILIKRSYEKKLQVLVDDSPLAMLAVDENSGELLFVNRPAMQLLGIRLIGKKYLFPFLPKAQSLHETLSHISGLHFKNYLVSWSISEDYAFKIELTGRKSSYRNRRIWIIHAIKHNELAPDGKQVEASLKIARSALDSLSELIHVHDNDGNTLDTNKAFDRFWEGREDEINNVSDGIMEGLNSHRRWTTDSYNRSCLLETSLTSLLSDDGERLGTLSISHDVTDWFKMQQDLRDEMERRKGTEIALAQTDIFLQSILESSPDVIALFNEELVYEACNQAYIDSLELDINPEQLVGKKLEDILPAHLKERFIETDCHVLANGETLRYIDEIRDKNGNPKWYDVVKSPYKKFASGGKGVLLLARDISDRYLAEQKLEEMNQELARLSFLDGLTQVANRRRFDEQLETLWNLHRRQKSALTVILCDIDFFKDYNDNYGHLSGDQALVKVAKAFQCVLTRSSDCVARYGGEEFAFILPNTDSHGAQIVASNIHQAVKKLNIEHQFSKVNQRITVSIGVASLVPLFGEGADVIIAHADDALYLAKKQGRNQTQYYVN